MIRTRTWATPLTICAFLVMAGTGVLMFFNVQHSLISGAHEWCSWAFLLGSVGHIIANIKPFKNHLKTRWGQVSVGIRVVGHFDGRRSA